MCWSCACRCRSSCSNPSTCCPVGSMKSYRRIWMSGIVTVMHTHHSYGFAAIFGIEVNHCAGGCSKIQQSTACGNRCSSEAKQQSFEVFLWLSVFCPPWRCHRGWVLLLQSFQPCPPCMWVCLQLFMELLEYSCCFLVCLLEYTHSTP